MSGVTPGYYGIHMVVWLFAHLFVSSTTKKFEYFIGFQKIQNQNVFQVILSNFDFLTPDPPLSRSDKTPVLIQ